MLFKLVQDTPFEVRALTSKLDGWAEEFQHLDFEADEGCVALTRVSRLTVSLDMMAAGVEAERAEIHGAAGEKVLFNL